MFQLLFRPVLLVNLFLASCSQHAWQSIGPFVTSWYENHQDKVIHIFYQHRTAGSNVQQVREVHIALGKRRQRLGPSHSDFLKKNPGAKVVIVVDTRSTQDGKLVIEEATNSDFLGPVCSPRC